MTTLYEGAYAKLNLTLNVAKKYKKTVAFFSLEMSNEQLASRVLSTEARVESNKLRSGEISPDEWMRLAEATDRLTKCNLYFDDTSTITVPEIKSKIKRAKSIYPRLYKLLFYFSKASLCSSLHSSRLS